jgi:hypothetical protein
MRAERSEILDAPGADCEIILSQSESKKSRAFVVCASES